MSDAERVRRLTNHVRKRLAEFLEPKHQAPHTIEGLCQDLKGVVADPALAFVATCTCAVIAELLVASRDGGIFPGEDALSRLKALKRIDKDHFALLSALGALRNACFHPAAMKANPEHQRHVEKLAELLRYRREEALAAKLSADYSQLRSPEMLAVAVRLVDELGIEELQR